jgi:hypothetical protein
MEEFMDSAGVRRRTYVGPEAVAYGRSILEDRERRKFYEDINARRQLSDVPYDELTDEERAVFTDPRVAEALCDARDGTFKGVRVDWDWESGNLKQVDE